MPELPEVETIVRALRPQLMGSTILGLRNDWPAQIVKPESDEFRRRIRNRKFKSLYRRGKFLVFELDQNETLLIHLKMSGHLSIVDQSLPNDKYVHTTFLLDGQRELRFRDVRKFGRVYLVHNPEEVLGNLGPEPLTEDFSDRWLVNQLHGRKRILKPLLLDQTFIAGIGNIYADESLFQARIKPDRRSDTLSTTEIQELRRAIQQVLQKGIRQEGASIDTVYRKPDGSMGTMQNSFAVYGRSGEDCIRCSGTIKKIILAGRGTHFCDQCQK